MNQENKPPDEPIAEEPVVGEIVGDENSDVTLNALARQDKGAGVLVAKAKVEALKVFRESSIGMTYPEDWTLFKRPDEAGGGITAYLSDAGCKRVLPLWGIDIVPESGRATFVVEKLDVGDDYLITVRGDAYNHTTKTWLRGLEGSRGSDDDFVKTVTSPTKKLSHVRKAAFRNLEGNAVRKHSGLDAMPLAELQRIWKPLGRDVNLCNRGKGFGGAATRYGEGGDEITGPKCPVCGGGMKFIKPSKPEQKWKPFWGCLKGKGKCTGTVHDSDWQAELARRAAQAPASAAEEPEAGHGEPDADEPPGGEKPANGEPILGVEKQKLLNRIKGKPWEKKFKAEVIKCADLLSVSDLATLISDVERGAGNA